MAVGVYAIVNLRNAKRYVGGAYKDFESRFQKHQTDLVKQRHWNKHLQAAWNKYGAAFFMFEVVEECPPDEELIKARETFWITKYQATNRERGYNQSPTGGSQLGMKWPGRYATQEARDKTSQATTGKKKLISLAVRQRLSMQRRLRKVSDVTKQRQSEAQKQAWLDEQRRETASTLSTERMKDPVRRAKSSSPGVSNGRAVLTEQLVLQMRGLRTLDPKQWTIQRLATHFNVSTTVTHRIVTGKSWKHLCDTTEVI